MSDENKEIKSGVTGEENQGGAADRPSYVTTSELKELFAEQQNSLFSMVRKMNSEPKQAKETPPKQSAKSSQPSDEVAALRRELEVQKAISKLGLTDAQETMLQKLAMAESPENIGDWVKEQASIFGKAEAQTEITPAKEVSPMPSTPAPATHSPSANGDKVTDWSKEEYQRDFQRNAPVPGNPYDIRNREYYREIRRRAEGEMARTSIYIGPPNRE